MKDTTTNRRLAEKLKTLCEGTPYTLTLWEREGFITPHLYKRPDAPEFTPHMYLDDDLDLTGEFRIGVQTTSYGALPPEHIMQVAQGLMTAARLAKSMSVALQLAGYCVYGG